MSGSGSDRGPEPPFWPDLKGHRGFWELFFWFGPPHAEKIDVPCLPARFPFDSGVLEMFYGLSPPKSPPDFLSAHY